MNQALSLVAHNGNLVVPSIINQSPLRVPIGGRIRPGIMVLTRAAEQNQRAVAIFERGVADGKSFEQIELEVKAAVPDLKKPLVPKNTPYFTVRRGDFANPDLAETILSKYGEDRGDGVVRLYRFPVVFAADQWQYVMPHSLKCYTTAGLKYWSEYSDDGRERHCMTYEKVPLDADGRRAVRMFGGRKHVRRTDNEGRCEPMACPEFQARQCNLAGSFIFFVPGIASLSPLELPTNSFYAMNAANGVFETVRGLRGGRISGFLHGQETFWMTKQLKEVPHIDDTGKAIRVKHYLITLEASVDPTRLLRGRDEEDVRASEAEHSAVILAGAVTAVGPDDPVAAANEHAPAPSPVGSPEQRETVESEVVDADPQEARRPARAPAARAANAAPATLAPRQGSGERAAAAMTELRAELAEMGIDPERFEQYISKKLRGEGWTRNEAAVRKALAEANEHRRDIGALTFKIEQELDTFA